MQYHFLQRRENKKSGKENSTNNGKDMRFWHLSTRNTAFEKVRRQQEKKPNNIEQRYRPTGKSVIKFPV